ncbi:protein-L-isoaspartate(D-aspartate) O-methyltransferase [Planctomicrobium sp. SH661]|uniref:protein-L-isoaspartate(D-aspartate) O-methyltransferase n=1 Tax=Planctomicrobium sp. SH661 TaxID=3448124 RepID=UPI003F5C2387
MHSCTSPLFQFKRRLPGLPLAFAVLLCLIQTASAQVKDRYAAPRHQMVQECIASEGVTDERVLEQMKTVPRHEFVRADLRHLAYMDQALDIGFKQTISPPFIVAYMTEVLEPQPTDRVLEIGTGSGYQAAVLSGLVQDVYTIEIVEPLGRRADALLKRLGYKNVLCKVGDGYQGWPEHAPFDKIIVTCSPEDIPKPLVDQLKEGGRMIIPIGERYQQVFYLLEKKDGKLEQKKLIPTLFVPMTGKMEELREKQPDPTRPQFSNGSFEVDDNDDSLADGWHYQRRSTIVEDAAAGKKSICFENHEAGRNAHILQAMAIDGSKVSQLTIHWAMKASGIEEGRSHSEAPGIVIYFFNDKRIPVEKIVVGPWLDDIDEWERFSETIRIPLSAREAIVQTGLNGGTGKLWLDDFRMEPSR